MKQAARVVSSVALVATILPPALFLGGRLDLDAVKLWMLLATVVWFLSAPLWMGRPT